jgi:chromate reductase, NAD(P)H dehydrogenase (quinone)
MVTIIGLCGSLRNGSFNRMLLHAAVELSPPGMTIEPESIGEIPLYDADVEDQGMPLAVQRLKERIAQADGLLIVTPEYNNSIPGVLKNATDWLSRPAEDIPRVFRGRPVAIMGATIGSGGTALSQAACLPVLRFLGMRPWFERAVLISDAARQFDGDGRLADAATRQRIRTFVEDFGAFVAQHGPHTALATPNPQLDVRSHGVMASGHREQAAMTS